jgi:hypothetical protein
MMARGPSAFFLSLRAFCSQSRHSGLNVDTVLCLRIQLRNREYRVRHRAASPPRSCDGQGGRAEAERNRSVAIPLNPLGVEKGALLSAESFALAIRHVGCAPLRRSGDGPPAECSKQQQEEPEHQAHDDVEPALFACQLRQPCGMAAHQYGPRSAAISRRSFSTVSDSKLLITWLIARIASWDSVTVLPSMVSVNPSRSKATSVARVSLCSSEGFSATC